MKKKKKKKRGEGWRDGGRERERERKSTRASLDCGQDEKIVSPVKTFDVKSHSRSPTQKSLSHRTVKRANSILEKKRKKNLFKYMNTHNMLTFSFYKYTIDVWPFIVPSGKSQYIVVAVVIEERGGASRFGLLTSLS
jgi:hypothetical protein